MDASNPANKQEDGAASEDSFWGQFTKHSDESDGKSPEELYNLGTQYFNTKQLPRAAELFELSCKASKRELHVACTNAVYLRTNLCDWGLQRRGV